MYLVLFRQVHDGIVHHLSNNLVLLCVLHGKYLVAQVSVKNILQSTQHIIPFLTLLLDGIRKLLGHKVTLGRVLHILWTYGHKINSSARIHAPCHLLLDILVENECLVHRHLPVVALRRIASAIFLAFDFVFGAWALKALRIQHALPSDGFDGHVFILITAYTITFPLLGGGHDAVDVFFDRPLLILLHGYELVL